MTVTRTGAGWEYLVMSNEELMKLPEYSCSVPTGTTIGKRWRRWTIEGTWIVGEYAVDPDPKMVQIRWYKTRTPEQWFKTGYDLILHPDIVCRDPYGVITQGVIHEYERIAGSFVAGWLQNAESIRRGNERPPYWLLRDFVLGITDVPLMVAAQIALHHCRPPVSKSSDCADDRDIFRARV